MAAVQAMTGGGGWPMSVFLTPDGRPFYGGTYFPNEPRHGMPSFVQVLEGVDRAWREQRSEIEGAGQRLVEALVAQNRVAAVAADPTPALLDAAAAGIEASFDARNGGWGSAPKFPQPMTIEFLLRRFVATGDARPLAIARRSLDAMADGGVRDQLGGGFHRYSTDAEWLVPHFEQMLYDNAQLARVYVHAWALTGDARYRAVGEATLDYMIRELTTSDGAFAASQDADTEGEEGATFVWTADEIGEVLGDDAPFFAAALRGDSARQLGGQDDPAPDEPARGRRSSKRGWPTHADACSNVVRGGPSRRATTRRSRPGTAWRSRPSPTRAACWAMRGMSRPRFVQPRPSSVDCSGTTAGSAAHGRTAGRWARACSKIPRTSPKACSRSTRRRSTSAGSRPRGTSWTECWRVSRTRPAASSIPRTTTSDSSPDPRTCRTTPRRPATPWRRSCCCASLRGPARAATGPRPNGRSGRSLRSPSDIPTAFAQWLSAIDFALSDAVEVAIVGNPRDAATRALLEPVATGYRPNQVLAVAAHPEGSAVPLLHDRAAVGGAATAYVCRGFTCRMPVTDAESLRAQLEEPARVA